MSKDKDYLIEIKVKNARILRLMEREGITSALQLAKIAGVGPSTVGWVLNMKIAAYRQSGEVRTHVDKICAVLKCMPEDLFPPANLHSPLKTNKTIFLSDVEDMALIGNSLKIAATPPDEKIELEGERREFFKQMRGALSEREYELICRHFGINGKEETMQEIGEHFNVSGGRIGQILAKAIRKLKHPERNKFGRSYFEEINKGKQR